MKRLYEAAAYVTPDACYWDQTVRQHHWSEAAGAVSCDVAIIGGGFTGLNAALHLAREGFDVALLDAETPGWGASGRNGGFCCLGGGRLGRDQVLRKHGPQAWTDWCDAQKMAVSHVETLIRSESLDVDRHSKGETLLAHAPRAMEALRKERAFLARDFGAAPELIEASDLLAHGLGGPFFGAVTTPVGFALNPGKYHSGLALAAKSAGARVYAHSPVHALQHKGAGYRLSGPNFTCDARKVILATNGYSSEDVPPWLRARTLPVLSSTIITRPLTQSEQEAQGWTSDQMAYDSRTLLHYFRKLPDDRFLFGMRGGLRATQRADAAVDRKIRRDFHAMFSAWKDVEITHQWSGLVCLTANLAPFCGEVPDHPGLFAGLGFHGNGVAMGSYTGRLLADLVQNKTPDLPYPDLMKQPPRRFPLGQHRRALLWPLYAMAGMLDR